MREKWNSESKHMFFTTLWSHWLLAMNWGALNQSGACDGWLFTLMSTSQLHFLSLHRTVNSSGCTAKTRSGKRHSRFPQMSPELNFKVLLSLVHIISPANQPSASHMVSDPSSSAVTLMQLSVSKLGGKPGFGDGWGGPTYLYWFGTLFEEC